MVPLDMFYLHIGCQY